LNYIDAKAILEACRCVRKGKVFSLAIPLDSNGPQRQVGGLNRFNPIHVMVRTGTDILAESPEPAFNASADDIVTMPTQCATQWDSLAHVVSRGKIYNGYSAATITSAGAAKNSIDKVKSKFVGRGLLLDLAAWKGVPSLEPGSTIGPDDLEKCLAHQKTPVRKGDFLLVHTGHMTRYQGKPGWGTYLTDPWPGLDLSTPLWLKEKQVAGVATDTVGVEVWPPQLEARAPWHSLAIANAGVSAGEMFYLKELADDCARDKQYDCLLVAPPLPITGGVASPVNPMAIK
ncbi:MAG: cyclase family protein, partial [Chloroflexi bacterium]|nr:cyclase family protein [Chloroflexota bacterium]